MKLLYLLLALILIPMFAAAQPHNENFLLDTAWIFNRNSQDKIIYTYNKKALLTERKRFHYNGLDWELEALSRRFYDEKDRDTLSIWENYEKNLGKPASYEYKKWDEADNLIYLRIKYFENGILTQEIIQESENNKEVLRRKYFENGILTQEIIEESENNKRVSYELSNLKMDEIKLSYSEKYYYNAKELLDSVIIKQFDDDGILSSYEKSSYYYNDQDSIELEIYFDSIPDPKYTSKTYTYNDGKLIRVEEKLKLLWDWRILSVASFQYNDQGQLISFDTTGTPVNHRVLRTYNGNNISSEIHEEKKESDEIWTPLRKYIAEYNDLDSITFMQNEYWYSDKKVWLPYKRYYKEYNRLGLVTSRIDEKVDVRDLNYVWIGVTKYTADYDSAGDLISELKEEWKESWINKSRFFKEYEGDSIVKDIYQLWNIDDWQDDRKITYFFDSYKNLIEVVSKIFENGVWLPYKISRDREGDRFIYSYINKNDVAVEDISSPELNFTVSPNPATGKIAVSYFLEEPSAAAISVISMEGKTLYSMPEALQNRGKHNTQIDISQLQPGVYIISFTVGGRSSSKKIIITK